MARPVTSSSKACNSARSKYHAAKKALDAMPASNKWDTPLEAYDRYLAANMALYHARKWAQYGTDKGVYAHHTANFHADYAFQHYAFLRDLANPVQLSPRTN